MIINDKNLIGIFFINNETKIQYIIKTFLEILNRWQNKENTKIKVIILSEKK